MEPLVLIPGMMCDARLFSHQIARFSTERAVHVAHLGQSSAVEDMARDVLASAPERFALAGHGLGGIVAMDMLRRAPDRISRIALMDVNPLAETPQAAADREPRITLARAGRLADAMMEEIPGGALAAGPARANIQARIRDMALGLGPDTFARHSRALMRRPDHQRTMRTAMLQALILCGEFDTICPVRRHEFMAELMPHAEFRIIRNAGHMPTLEAPDAVTSAMVEWLAKPFLLKKPMKRPPVSPPEAEQSETE